MAHDRPPVSGTFNQGKPPKLDLAIMQKQLEDEFKSQAVNGSITIHYAYGVKAKIHANKVY